MIVKGPEVAAESFDCGNARNRKQPILDVELCEIAQRHQVSGARCCFQRELIDFIETPGDSRQQWRFGSRRQLGAYLIHALGNKLTGSVVVGIRLEFDGDLTDAKL